MIFQLFQKLSLYWYGIIMMVDLLPEAKLRIRMSYQDVHYAGNLVDGARIMQLFGDLATELTINHDGDEGLLRAYENVEFLAPVHGGDFIEAKAKIINIGKTSRKITFEAYKIISPKSDAPESACDVLESPILVAKATGTTVVPLDRQKK